MRTGVYQKYVRQVFQCMDDVVWEVLRMTTYDQPTKVHLGDGLTVRGVMSGETGKYIPVSGEQITLPERIRATVKFSTWYQHQLNRPDGDHNEELDKK